MAPVWLSYTPGDLIQERQDLVRAYNVRHAELDVEIGRVELYWSREHQDRQRWRTLDPWLCDFSRGHVNREEAAQHLLAESPRVRERLEMRRKVLARALEDKVEVAGGRAPA